MNPYYPVMAFFIFSNLLGRHKTTKSPPEAPTSCIEEEFHLPTDTLFRMGDPGRREHGWATAMRLGKKWEASTEVWEEDITLFFMFSTAPKPSVTRLYETIIGGHSPKK